MARKSLQTRYWGTEPLYRGVETPYPHFSYLILHVSPPPRCLAVLNERVGSHLQSYEVVKNGHEMQGSVKLWRFTSEL